MYAAVPRIMPICVAWPVSVGEVIASALDAPAGSIAFASPKSSTFTVPSARTLMFAGFRSRWMIPCSCAASSASAICFAIGNASASGIGPFAMRSASVGPSTSSITSASVSVRLLEAVDVRDVRMVQGGEDFGFALESGQALGVGADGLGQDLDGDLALEVGVGGAIDLAHSAGAEGGDDFIRAEARAGSQSHPWRILAQQTWKRLT